MKRGILILLFVAWLGGSGCQEHQESVPVISVPGIELPPGPHANVIFQETFSDTIVLQLMKDGTVYLAGQRSLLRELTSLLETVYLPGTYTVVIRAQPETPYIILQQALQAVESSRITARRVLLAARGRNKEERAFAYGLWFGGSQPLKSWRGLMTSIQDQADPSATSPADGAAVAGYARLTVDVQRRGYRVAGQLYDRSGLFTILRRRRQKNPAILIVYRVPAGLPYHRLIDCCDHAMQFGISSYAFQTRAPGAPATSRRLGTE